MKSVKAVQGSFPLCFDMARPLWPDVFKQLFPHSPTDIWARPRVFQPVFPGKLKTNMKTRSSLPSICPHFPDQIQPAGGMARGRTRCRPSLTGPMLTSAMSAGRRASSMAPGDLKLSSWWNSLTSAEVQPVPGASEEALHQEQDTFIWRKGVSILSWIINFSGVIEVIVPANRIAAPSETSYWTGYQWMNNRGKWPAELSDLIHHLWSQHRKNTACTKLLFSQHAKDYP